MDRRHDDSRERDRYRGSGYDRRRGDDQRSRDYYDYDRSDKRGRNKDDEYDEKRLSRDHYDGGKRSGDKYEERKRSRDEYEARRRSRSRSKSPVNLNEKQVHKTIKDDLPSNLKEPVEVIEAGADEDVQLAAFLGFSGFASTKGQQVKGNAFNGAVDVGKGGKKKHREYRQYLYVKGSYDIPLTKDQLESKEAGANVNKYSK